MWRSREELKGRQGQRKNPETQACVETGPRGSWSVSGCSGGWGWGVVCIGTEVGPYEGPEHSRDRVGFRFSQDPPGCRGMIVGVTAWSRESGKTATAVVWDQEGGSRGWFHVHVEDQIGFLDSPVMLVTHLEPDTARYIRFCCVVLAFPQEVLAYRGKPTCWCARQSTQECWSH